MSLCIVGTLAEPAEKNILLRALIKPEGKLPLNQLITNKSEWESEHCMVFAEMPGEVD